jgi:hypothetical protein
MNHKNRTSKTDCKVASLRNFDDKSMTVGAFAPEHIKALVTPLMVKDNAG